MSLYRLWMTWLQPLSSAYSSQLNSAHGPNTHVQYGGILQRLTEPRSPSAHQCHSCMTLHQTARTSPVKQHTSWRWIPHFLTMPLHSHFLPSINSVLWKLDIHTFFEAVNFMESVHPRWVRRVLTINKKHIFYDPLRFPQEQVKTRQLINY